MRLSQLKELAAADQRVFLLGRIASETTAMDAALRFVHAALQGEDTLDAFLDAPDYVSSNIKACKKLLAAEASLEPAPRKAIGRTLSDAAEVYRIRNRFIHDQLRRDLIEPQWQLAGLSRNEQGEQTITPVTFDAMVELVCDIVAVTWRLRGATFYIRNRSWSGSALGVVIGHWDGSADYS